MGEGTGRDSAVRVIVPSRWARWYASSPRLGVPTRRADTSPFAESSSLPAPSLFPVASRSAMTRAATQPDGANAAACVRRCRRQLLMAADGAGPCHGEPFGAPTGSSSFQAPARWRPTGSAETMRSFTATAGKAAEGAHRCRRPTAAPRARPSRQHPARGSQQGNATSARHRHPARRSVEAREEAAWGGSLRNGACGEATSASTLALGSFTRRAGRLRGCQTGSRRPSPLPVAVGQVPLAASTTASWTEMGYPGSSGKTPHGSHVTPRPGCDAADPRWRAPAYEPGTATSTPSRQRQHRVFHRHLHPAPRSHPVMLRYPGRTTLPRRRRRQVPTGRRFRNRGRAPENSRGTADGAGHALAP